LLAVVAMTAAVAAVVEAAASALFRMKNKFLVKNNVLCRMIV
jgi:hypothetical protein